MRRHGHILEQHRRSPQEYRFHEDYFEISMRNHKGEIVAWAIADIDDFDKITKYKWFLTKGGYAESKESEHIKMHHLVFKKPDNEFVIYHSDKNKLNNRKKNLREVTKSMNSFNRDITPSGSGCVGVHFDKARGKWLASIQKDSKNINLGRFENLEDAIKSRKNAELFYYGEYK
jgi:hypothetical protein